MPEVTAFMQAIHISSFLPEGSLSSLKPSIVPKPIPEHDECLVQITHTSLQQVDLLYAQGKHQNNNAKRGHVHPPFILGLDFSGVVKSVPLRNDGQDWSQTLRPGDRVMGAIGGKLGAFAEYICIKASQLKRVPQGLSNANAAALVGGVVSYDAVCGIARVAKGETVLVTGVPGGLGVVACQVAMAKGAQVIALASTPQKASDVKARLGLQHVLAARDAEGESWVAQVLAITGGRGVNAVIDNVGVVEDSLRCIAYGGRIVLVGFAGRDGVMEKVGMNKILLKGAHVIGYRFGESSRQNPKGQEQIWDDYLAILGSGRIRPLVDSRAYHGVAAIPRALQNFADKVLSGKAIISLNKEHTKANI